MKYAEEIILVSVIVVLALATYRVAMTAIHFS